MKYKVGDKFIVEILGVDSNLSAPYDTALSRFTECQLRCIPQLVNGVDMDNYNKGIEDAWEIARLISTPPVGGGFVNTELFEMFRTSNKAKIFAKPYKEVKAKVDLWKEAQKEIKVGDEVYTINSCEEKGVVSRIETSCYYVVWYDGSSGSYDKIELLKTGRNFADKLNALIGEMRN